MDFRTPFTLTLCGSTSSGKTFWLKKYIENAIENKTFKKIVYHYSVWQPLFDDMSGVEFREGLPDNDSLAVPEGLCVLDDMLASLCKSKFLLELFTVKSHHLRVSVIFVTQSLF